jgi:sterol desaturase/sphingolipid hydroxylase (fatty acid hydroxylase superfamily)
MTAKRTAFIVSSFLILPILYAFFYTLHFVVEKDTIAEWLPRWDRIAIIGSIILLERIYTYRYAVSQRAVLTRDLIANVVNLYGTGALTALIVLPAVSFVPMYFLGRKAVFASPDQLGPLWLQIGTIFLIVSFFRYWMHRLQHENEFLWSFHAYHHSVTDLKAINGYVSHPVDYALRNIVIFILLGAVGFDAAASGAGVSIMWSSPPRCTAGITPPMSRKDMGMRSITASSSCSGICCLAPIICRRKTAGQCSPCISAILADFRMKAITHACC